MNEQKRCVDCGWPLQANATECASCGTKVSVPPPVVIAPVMRKARFWRRGAALAIDSLIVALITYGTSRWVPRLAGALFGPDSVELLTWLAEMVIEINYFAIPYATTGQTLGKKWLRLRVVTLDGSPLTWRKGFIRWFGGWFSMVPLCLGFLWSIWDRDKQTWHDKLASTTVINDVRGAEAPPPSTTTETAYRRQKRWAIGFVLGTVLFGVGVAWLSLTQVPEPYWTEEQGDATQVEAELVHQWLARKDHADDAVDANLASFGLRRLPTSDITSGPSFYESAATSTYAPEGGGATVRLIAYHYGSFEAFQRANERDPDFSNLKHSISNVYCVTDKECEWGFFYGDGWVFAVMTFGDDAGELGAGIIRALAEQAGPARGLTAMGVRP